MKTCNQADLDLWLADHPGHRTRTANFTRWAVTHRHAFHLTAPSTRWPDPAGPLDQDRRWADARRLLHDNSCPVADRAAGLLILLYAQKLSDITALTTENVRHLDGRAVLNLGSRPITLPSPLDALIDDLVLTRKAPGSTVLTEESNLAVPGPMARTTAHRRCTVPAPARARARPAAKPERRPVRARRRTPSSDLGQDPGHRRRDRPPRPRHQGIRRPAPPLGRRAHPRMADEPPAPRSRLRSSPGPLRSDDPRRDDRPHDPPTHRREHPNLARNLTPKSGTKRPVSVSDRSAF